jgi:hypothetical protein
MGRFDYASIDPSTAAVAKRRRDGARMMKGKANSRPATRYADQYVSGRARTFCPQNPGAGRRFVERRAFSVRLGALAMPEAPCRCGKIETISNLYRWVKAYPLDL